MRVSNSARASILFFLSFFIVGIGDSIAQQNVDMYANFRANNKPHIVGELDTLGDFTIGSGCPIESFYQGTGGVFTYVYANPAYGATSVHGYVMYMFPSEEEITDTVKFYLKTSYTGGPCQGGFETWHLSVNAYASSDSLFRIRPTYQPLHLLPDTSLKAWTASFQMTFDNNWENSILVQNWQVIDDTLVYSLQGFYKGSPVSSFSLKPYQRYVPIDFVVTLKHGPIYSSIKRPGAFTAEVTEAGYSSHYVNALALDIPPAPYTFRSFLSQDSLLFNNDPNTSVFRKILLHLDPATSSYTIPPVSTPFSIDDTKLDDTTRELTVSCTPKSSGNYFDKVKMTFIKPDFNGAPRKDSLFMGLASNSNGLLDGIFWQQFASNTRAEKVLSAKVGSIYASTGKELLHTQDSGTTWSAILISDSVCHQFAVDTSERIYRIASNAHLFVSTDQGLSWGLSNSGLTQSYGCFNQQQQTFDIDVGVLSISAGKFFCSGSKSIQFYCGRDTYTATKGGRFSLSKNQNIWLQLDTYGIGSTYLDSANNPVYISGANITNGLLNYTWKCPGLITAFAVDRWGNYFVGTSSSGLFRSSDNGFSWQSLSLFEPDIRSIATTPPGDIFLASYGNGVYRSTDNGNNWEGVNGGLTTNKVNDIIAVPGEPLYLATDDAWVWKSKYIVPIKNAVRKSVLGDNIVFELSPNPAQSQLTIHYSLPENVSGKLSLCDLLGNEMMLFDKERIIEGENSIPIDLSNLHAGIYFCKLQTVNATIVKKVIRY